ncbi:hypothetical protein P3T37_007432, partial [Kitasatospora sp. MAA4]|nr:hypothetical protein [Kitasatospora sp. MAA4]
MLHLSGLLGVLDLRPFVDGLRAALLVTAAASVIAALVWLLALP